MNVAQNITVDAKGILIDGKRLPYWLAPDDIEVVVDAAGPHFSEVRITLLAETVSITPDIEARAEGDVILLEEEVTLA